MLEQAAAQIVLPIDGTHNEWACYQVVKVIDIDPIVIYVGAERIADLYYLAKLRCNTDFIRIAPIGPQFLGITILATGEKIEMLNHATRVITAMAVKPRCNLMGANLKASTRPLLCSNGQTYASQVAAAEALGVNQSNISQHLKGKISNVRGYTFVYK